MDFPAPFGDYSLDRRLAFGGMAEVFVGHRLGEAGFRRPVVVKRILPQFNSDPAFTTMFADEAVIAARLQHRNIVQVYDFGEVDGVFYLAMEYIEGIDLRTLLQDSSSRGEQLPLGLVASVVGQVARALDYAHGAVGEDGQALGIVHRDVSPANVMLGYDGSVKLMDFGVARARDRATKTKTGMIKGKLAYMAPEHAGGHAIDGRADQFALGVVLWECLAGERLYVGDSDLELLRRVTAAEVRPLKSLRPDLPEAMAATVDRMLAADPADRFADLRAVADALGALGLSAHDDVERYLGARSVVAPEAVGGTVPAQPRRPAADAASPPPTRWPWAVGALVLGIAAVLGVALWREPQPIRVTSDPAGARVTVDGIDVGLLTPTELPRATNGGALRLGFSLEGHEPRALVAPHDRTQVHVALRAIAAPASDPAPTATSPPSVTKAPPPRPPLTSPQAKARHHRRTARGKVQPIQATGSLSLRTSGAWAEVYLGDRLLGTTPLQRVEIPAGRHALTLVNGGAGIRESVVVVIEAGSETRTSVPLR